MNLRVVSYLALRLGFLGILGGAVPALAADAPPVDPPNGFQTQALGATRLSGEQARQVKAISSAPLSQFYPKEALMLRRTGKVVVDLLIDADGNVKDALALDEDPLGVGFGEAAVAVARTYKFLNPYKKLIAIRTVTQFVP